MSQQSRGKEREDDRMDSITSKNLLLLNQDIAKYRISRSQPLQPINTNKTYEQGHTRKTTTGLKKIQKQTISSHSQASLLPSESHKSFSSHSSISFSPSHIKTYVQGHTRQTGYKTIQRQTISSQHSQSQKSLLSLKSHMPSSPKLTFNLHSKTRHEQNTTLRQTDGLAKEGEVEWNIRKDETLHNILQYLK